MEPTSATLTGIAVLIQLAALVAAVGLVRRHPSPSTALTVAGVLLIMTIRRALAFASPFGPRWAEPLSITHEAAGLAGSLLVLAAVAVALSGPHDSTEAPTVEPPVADELLSALEQERELLCYDLHDGVAPLVVGAQMQLETCKAAFRAGGERAEQELRLLDRRLQEAVDEVQRLIADLSLTISEDVPLAAAIRSHLTKLAAVQGWQYELDDALGPRRFDATIETMVYRVVQEALNNAAKHAQTGRVHVSLRLDDGDLVAAVQDWGAGFDPERAEGSPRRLGLRGMCNRARLMGGRCEIQSEPGVGTRVAVYVPRPVTGGVR